MPKPLCAYSWHPTGDSEETAFEKAGSAPGPKSRRSRRLGLSPPRVEEHDGVVTLLRGWMRSAWREHLRVKLTVLDSDAGALSDTVAGGRYKTLATGFLASSREAVDRPGALSAGWTGVDVEQSWVGTHAAEVAIVRGSTLDQVTAVFPSLVADCAAILPKDSRVASLKKVVDTAHVVDETHHALLGDTLESAYATSDAQHVRVRSFRNILLGTTVLLSFFVVLVGVIGSWAPKAFALCGAATGTSAVCPTGGAHPSGGDVFLVELLGLLAASITGATSIRNLSGTSTPYAVPIVSLALKLPIGALTALGGLFFLRAGFGPTITSLNQAQICAYALVFGASQQLFMQFVDKQAKTVLDAATTPGDKTKAS
jgi:hypothetical protein